jgi:hypothetical protein
MFSHKPTNNNDFGGAISLLRKSNYQRDVHLEFFHNKKFSLWSSYHKLRRKIRRILKHYSSVIGL